MTANGCPPSEVEALRTQVVRLTQQLEAARRALEYYANEKNYDEEGVPGTLVKSWDDYYGAWEYDWDADYGERASSALAETGAGED